ncbi:MULTISPECIES: hypothetical protein [Bacillus amyloliquefaciens group]|uniref:hypothetical protein n=1 Tax=Bacillus amyloliquefaciens group TaxID=1938374 RepID=UPI000E5C56BC|nr:MULTISPECIES: hypothetical protein [Bacillus amyloliquefaciens group]AXY38664.1 hypothetical protein D3C60_13160 [Bacillus velezensis]MBI0443286.1 hypothetical protein [Bacillus velezensis]MEC1370661.1 hypothetical protein [Bacillus velezensis]NIH00924.1 hypothetical protein [Bacillus amyloliquefaciens]
MKTAWLVLTTKSDDWEDIDSLSSFSEKDSVLRYLGGLTLSDDTEMKRLYEIDLIKGEISEMELILNKGKLDIDYVKKVNGPVPPAGIFR